MSDERNHLFWDYQEILRELDPDGFVFENVTGLLNIEKGRVFAQVKSAFRDVMPRVDAWLLSADEYAVPQRRKRVFLVGTRDPDRSIDRPERSTACDPGTDLFADLKSAIGVAEALSDLPPLSPGEDGSLLSYVGQPISAYQALMRGFLRPDEYLARVAADKRTYSART